MAKKAAASRKRAVPKRSASASKHTVLTKAELHAHQQNLPKSRHGHNFAPNKVPDGFHTLIDPNKNPLAPDFH